VTVARPRRRRRRGRWLLPLIAALVCFGIGVAVGEALHDNPQVGGTQTIVRTLTPRGLAPAPGRTVTVTSTTTR
jgi:hypothetical protein